MQQASLIFTNSETTRHEVIRQYECAPDRVVAAPYAPIRILCKQSCFSESPVAGLQEGHFYLYPSAWALHKGFRTLTEALEMAEHIDPVVVTCGDPLSGIEGAVPGVAALRRELEPRWRKLVATGRLKIFSYMPDQQMLWLSRKCKALILPSDYEGYGLPLAEAVYHHRPAIVSSIPAHCEILDRYPQYRLATLFQPGAAEELALCLNRSEAETSPETTGWAEEIDSTWSWMHTAGRILAALG
ncbi:MAG: glycosyltransferase [Terracidiphilus sp.]|nr:glycosyltransferase [Terracidiphilus sp.]